MKQTEQQRIQQQFQAMKGYPRSREMSAKKQRRERVKRNAERRSRLQRMSPRLRATMRRIQGWKWHRRGCRRSEALQPMFLGDSWMGISWTGLAWRGPPETAAPSIRERLWLSPLAGKDHFRLEAC